MNILKELIGFILLRFRLLNWKTGNGVLSVYFHNPSPKLFSSVVGWLSMQGFKFISVNDLDNLIGTNRVAEKLAVITFDDGNIEFRDLIPVIEKYKIPVTVFVPIDPVNSGNYWWDYAGIQKQSDLTGLENIEGFKKIPADTFDEKIEILKAHFNIKRTCLELTEVKEISRHPLITIGSHTVTHPILKNCTRNRQQNELQESKRTLESWLESKVHYLAYPNGDYNNDTLEIARAEGYKLAFTTKPGIIDPLNVDRLQIPRYSVNDDGGYYENLAKVTGIWQSVFPVSL